MSAATHHTIANRFAALAVDDEVVPTQKAVPTRTSPPTSPPTTQRRSYVPPNLRRNQQMAAPVTQSRLAAPPPNVSSSSDFPSLGARHTPVAANPPRAAAAAGAGWASRARSWAEHDEHVSAQQEQERRRRREEQEQMTTLYRPRFRAPPTYAPGTASLSRTYNSVRMPIQYDYTEEADDDIDAAEAYVGGYDHARYDSAACDYNEEAEDQYAPPDDGRYTPPYPPTPY